MRLVIFLLGITQVSCMFLQADAWEDYKRKHGETDRSKYSSKRSFLPQTYGSPLTYDENPAQDKDEYPLYRARDEPLNSSLDLRKKFTRSRIKLGEVAEELSSLEDQLFMVERRTSEPLETSQDAKQVVSEKNEGDDETKLTSIIGSYSVGFGFTFASSNDLDETGFAIGSNFALHPNFSIGLATGFSEAEFESLPIEGNSFSGSVNFIFHKRFERGSVAITPFVNLSTGFASAEFEADFPYDDYDVTVIPIGLYVGSEFTFSDFFLLAPRIGMNGYLNDDGMDLDSSFYYSLSAEFLALDSFSVGLAVGGYSNDSNFINLSTRYHY